MEIENKKEDFVLNDAYKNEIYFVLTDSQTTIYDKLIKFNEELKVYNLAKYGLTYTDKELPKAIAIVKNIMISSTKHNKNLSSIVEIEALTPLNQALLKIKDIKALSQSDIKTFSDDFMKIIGEISDLVNDGIHSFIEQVQFSEKHILQKQIV